MKKFTQLLALFLALAVVLSGCGTLSGPTATEVEIVVNPADLVTESPTQPAESLPQATNTLRPTPLESATPEPTATEALDPYSALLAEARALAENDDLEAALAKINEAVNLAPNDARGYVQRGMVLGGLDKLDEAITDFNFAINYAPNDPTGYNARGITFTRKGQFEQAIRDFNKALEIKPDYTQALTNRAIAFLQQEKVDEALVDFNKAVEISPDNPEVYFNRGQAYLTIFQNRNEVAYLDQCVADFNQVLAFSPENAESLVNRGSCKLLQGKVAEAYDDYSQAIALDANQARYYLFRASLYPDAGTMEQALADAQKVLELTKDEEMLQAANEMLAAIPTTPTSTPKP